jgi:hemolysin III
MYVGERLNTWTHLLGLVLALVALPLLMAQTWPSGDAARIGGALVFALTCIALYGASAGYHGTRGPAKLRWQRADHCAIFLLIAGSYTPFALVTLGGLWGWVLLAAMWGIAGFGIWRELRSTQAQPSLALYIGMGWVGVLAAAPLFSRLDAGGLIWLVVGGVLYTVGTVFYVNRAGHRHAHGLWHLFVLGGTASHYMAIAGFVV